MQELVKVWPLVPNVLGCDALGRQLALTPGLPGWLPSMKVARLAQEAGQVQIMAGLRPQDLKVPAPPESATPPPTPPAAKPVPAARATKKSRVYKRRDLTAEGEK